MIMPIEIEPTVAAIPFPRRHTGALSAAAAVLTAPLAPGDDGVLAGGSFDYLCEFL